MPTDAGFNVVRGALNRELRRHTNAGYGCRYITVALAELDRLEAQQAEDDALHVQVVAERAALEAERDEARKDHRRWMDRCLDETKRSRQLAEALSRIEAQQPKTLETLRKHGVVFDGPLGNDPKNWQHVAFTIYTDLCEVDLIARQALAETDSPVFSEFDEHVEDFIDEYAWHTRDCSAVDGDGDWDIGNPTCTCGYDEALAALASPSRDSAEREESHG